MDSGKDELLSAGSGRRLLTLLLVFVLFLSLGAIVGSNLESPRIRALTELVEETRFNFLNNNSCVKENSLEDLIEVTVFASRHGVSPLKDADNDYVWNFGDGIFFTTVFLLTIGYGHIVLINDFSKVFFVAYGAVGIPFTYHVINAFVEELTKPTKYVLTLLNIHLGHIYQPFKIRIIHFALMATLVLVSVVIIPATIFTSLEPGWSFLDSIYYIFISLTTIGLGDYVPSDGIDKKYFTLYRLTVTVYLIWGMVGIMLIMTLYYDIPQLQQPRLIYPNDSLMDDFSETLYLAKDPPTSYSMLSNNPPHLSPPVPPPDEVAADHRPLLPKFKTLRREHSDDSIHSRDSLYTSSSNRN